MRIRREKTFVSFFDERNGTYLRTGILANGKDTGKDPFMASFPELLDVGIMGHCNHGKKGLCLKAQVQCYQDGLHSDAQNMSLEDFSSIVEQSSGKTFQFALGGCGDPDEHESFADILELCSSKKIVPNFTTSGYGLTKEKADLCRKHCGAVAVSWYRSEYTLKAIKLLLDCDVKTNIHYVLNTRTIQEAMTRLQEDSFPAGINAVIFLLHKPVGLGLHDVVIDQNCQQFFTFLQYATSHTFRYKIGFDSCTVPALLQTESSFDVDSIDTCEAARWSAYVTPDNKLLPCSFDNQQKRWAVDLHHTSIQDAWFSETFEAFRKHFKKSCPECVRRERCLGGCPICPEIVVCSDKKIN